MISSLRKSKGTFTHGPWSKEELQTTYRADYQPFHQNSLQLNRPGPQHRLRAATAVLTGAPEIDSDTWARFRRYCSKTSNSVYGSSTFGQKGQSFIVSVLQRDKDFQTSGAGGDPGTLPCLEKPTTRPLPPSPQGCDTPSPSGSSSSIAPKPPSVYFSSANLTTPTHPSMFISPTPSPALSRCHKEAWTQGTSIKETVAGASRLPHIGSGEGSTMVKGEQGEGQEGGSYEGGSYEGFLQSLCLSAKLGRALSLCSRSPVSHRGRVSLGNVMAFKHSFTAQREAPEHTEPQRLDRKRTHCRSPWVSEYADQYGSIRRVCPPHPAAPLPSTPPPASSQPTVPETPPKPRSPRTEYQASYSKTLSCRTALSTCPEYRLGRRELSLHLQHPALRASNKVQQFYLRSPRAVTPSLDKQSN